MKICKEANLLANWKVSKPIVYTTEGMKLVRYIWIFAQKQNENDEIVR